jgi:hypothetical protein
MERLYAVRLYNLLQTYADLGARMAELRRFREIVREAERRTAAKRLLIP